jgi:hypothetical protein
MTKHRTIRTMCGAAGVAALLVTAGCSASSAGEENASGSPSATTAAPSDSPAASATASPGESPADESPEPAATASESDDGGDAGSASGRCQSPELAGSLVPVEGGGGAGHYEVQIVLKNEAPQTCTLQGWPGTSFVGDGDGEQIGAAATFDRSSLHGTVTLEPGASAQAVVRVSNAENYGDECGQTPADGLRIYPPGEKRSLFVQNDQLTLTACADIDDPLLQVQALQPAG